MREDTPTVIFDLDGTLADTSADLIAAANACFEELGLGSILDAESDASTAFRGARAMLKLGFTRLDADDLTTLVEQEYPKFLDHYARAIYRKTSLYPGVVDAVAGIRAAGIRTGICTNKPEAMAVTLIDRLGISDLFDSLIGADTLPVRKPDPEPLRVAVHRAGGTMPHALLIGDTETDLETARRAGVACIMVAFGPDADALRGMGADGYLEAYSELEACLAPLISLS